MNILELFQNGFSGYRHIESHGRSKSTKWKQNGNWGVIGTRGFDGFNGRGEKRDTQRLGSCWGPTLTRVSLARALAVVTRRWKCLLLPPRSPTQTSPVPEQPTNLSVQCAQTSMGPHLPDQHQQQLKSPNQSSDYMFDRFRKWAISNYGDSGKTKTVTRKKYQRIVRILSGDELPTSDNSKFRFWVKNKGFRLGPPPPDEIGADDQVLYVPTRVQVSAFSCFLFKKVKNTRISIVVFLTKWYLHPKHFSSTMQNVYVKGFTTFDEVVQATSSSIWLFLLLE